MAKVIIYTRPFCGYCARAIHLLTVKEVDFQQIDIGKKPEKRKEMQEKSGRNTFPQIFINDQHIGGCDDLYKLEENNRLDLLLQE